MPKMQRWRRSRSEVDRGATAELPELDAVDPHADPIQDSVVDSVVDSVDDSAEVPAPVEDTGETQIELGQDPDAPGDDPADEADEPEPPTTAPERFELPHVPERSGISGFLPSGRSAEDMLLVQLLQAAHAKQAVTTALAVGLVAAVAGRPAREAGVVLLTVLVGQTILGWHNDIVDRQRDASHDLTGKPLAMGRIESGTVWYAIVVATLLLVPLAITTGIRAGCLYLAAVAVGMLGNVLLRTGFFSWWSWAVSFALIPAYLSYGGWGGQAVGSAPEPAIVGLAAALGVGVHFMRSVWGLVADHADGWTYLPLKLGLKLGATRLLALSTVYTAAIVIALVVVGAQVGLSR